MIRQQAAGQGELLGEEAPGGPSPTPLVQEAAQRCPDPQQGESVGGAVLCMCLLLYSNKTLTEGKKNMIKQKPTASSVSRKDTGYFR